MLQVVTGVIQFGGALALRSSENRRHSFSPVKSGGITRVQSKKHVSFGWIPQSLYISSFQIIGQRRGCEMKSAFLLLLASELLIIRSDATPLAKKPPSDVIEFPVHENPKGIWLKRRANEDTLSQVLRETVSIN